MDKGCFGKLGLTNPALLAAWCIVLSGYTFLQYENKNSTWITYTLCSTHERKETTITLENSFVATRGHNLLTRNTYIIKLSHLAYQNVHHNTEIIEIYFWVYPWWTATRLFQDGRYHELIGNFELESLHETWMQNLLSKIQDFGATSKWTGKIIRNSLNIDCEHKFPNLRTRLQKRPTTSESVTRVNL